MSAFGLDHSLLYQVRKFITAANVHRVKTWMFCYRTSAPDSEPGRRYEKLLREFVVGENRLMAARASAALAMDKSA